MPRIAARNPVLPGFYPDPSVCRVGDDYYLVTSTFEYFPGVPIFHSRDLSRWQQIGHVLTRPSQLPLEGITSSKGIFAPTLRHHRGTFYLVTTNVEGGGNFLVTASDPRGPWSEPLWIRESEWGMDPSLYFEADGTVIFTRHGGLERGGIYQTTIDVERGTLHGTPELVWKGTGGIWPEGPHLYRRGEFYYLLISEGGTSYGHCVTVARSRSAFGPFEENPRNPILTHRDRPHDPIQATGHADLVEAPDGSWWMIFLGIRPSTPWHHHLGRETFLAPVEWDAEGWPVVNGGHPISLAASEPIEAEHDDFDAAELGLSWLFVRNPNAGSWSLCERPGFLRLHGSRATLDERVSPACVLRRQTAFEGKAELLLDFEPAALEQEAGLVLRQNEDNHYEVFVTQTPEGKRVRARTRVQGATALLADRPLPPGPVVLGVRAFPERYEFFSRALDGSALETLGEAPTAALSSESATGFTGVMWGPFAQTRSAHAMPPADVDWFRFTP